MRAVEILEDTKTNAEILDRVTQVMADGPGTVGSVAEHLQILIVFLLMGYSPDEAYEHLRVISRRI